jgi:hypothetical protein
VNVHDNRDAQNILPGKLSFVFKSFEQLFNYFVAGIFCEGVLVSILKKRTSGHKKDLKIQKVIRNLKSKKDRQYNDNKAKGHTTIYKTYIQN